MTRITPCIWCDGTAAEQAEFYARTLPDSRVVAIHRTPIDTPAQSAGEVVVAEVELAGQPYILLNGGPIFPQTEAVSFMIPTRDQTETDRLWAAMIADGGRESACGWCKDRWGVSWQITPLRLMELIYANSDHAAASRAMAAMMTMRKIDLAVIEAAAAGTKGEE